MLRTFALLAVALMLLPAAGCGNKGPLYLPQDTAPPAPDAARKAG
jgi:predicted small lipoprotein YifL